MTSANALKAVMMTIFTTFIIGAIVDAFLPSIFQGVGSAITSAYANGLSDIVPLLVVLLLIVFFAIIIVHLRSN